MKNQIELFWVWSDDLKHLQKIQVKVLKTKKTSYGVFGNRRLVSNVFNYPDSMELTGTVIGGDQYTKNKPVHLTAPAKVFQSVKDGDFIELEFSDTATGNYVSGISNITSQINKI